MHIEQFRSAVQLGLGRAVLHVDGKLHSRAVLDGCLHSKAYDPHVEGSRTWYTMQLIERSGRRHYYAKKIIASPREDADRWDAGHRFALAAQFAEAGDVRARKAMTEAFECAEFDLMQGSFAVEWLGLGGLVGYLYAIEHIGRSLRDGRGNYVDGWLQSSTEQQLGEEIVRSAMRASPSENVAAYVKLVDEESRPTTREAFVFDGDLNRAAAELAGETEIEKLRELLNVFCEHACPGDGAPLLALAASPIVDVQGRALGAVGNVNSDKVRDFAISMIEGRVDRRSYALRMLAANFREGDHEYLLSWIERDADPSTFVGSISNIRGIFKNHPNDAVERQILNALYEKIPCPCCRYEVVKGLLQVPAECAWDSYEETRALVA